MKLKWIMLSIAGVLIWSPFVLASSCADQMGKTAGCSCHQKQMPVSDSCSEASVSCGQEDVSRKTHETSRVKDAGNTVCPVSGEKIGSMGEGVQFEYKGKTYNFCCGGCVEQFQKKREEYLAKLEQQKVPKTACGCHTKSKDPG